jgi:hypothetical protein
MVTNELEGMEKFLGIDWAHKIIRRVETAERERDEARDMARRLLAAHRDGDSIGIPKEARWSWLLHQPPPDW